MSGTEDLSAHIDTVVIEGEYLGDDPLPWELDGGQAPGRATMALARAITTGRAWARIVVWAIGQAPSRYLRLVRYSPYAAAAILGWCWHWLAVTEVRRMQQRHAVAGGSQDSTKAEQASHSTRYAAVDQLLWRKRGWRFAGTLLPAGACLGAWAAHGWAHPWWAGRPLAAALLLIVPALLGALVVPPAEVVEGPPPEVEGRPNAELVAEWFRHAGITPDPLVPVALAHDPVRDELAKGYLIRLWLPKGVTTAKVRDRLPELAAAAQVNLRRLHLDDLDDSGAAENLIELFVADQDPMLLPPPGWPLLQLESLDMFGPAPIGTDGRLRPVLVSAADQHVLVVSRPRRGKTTALRVFAWWTVLDPRAQLAIFDLGQTAEFEVFRPLIREGWLVNDERAVHEALVHLRWMSAERQRRITRLRSEYGTSRLTTEQARYVRPHRAIIDEVHKLLGHPEWGEEAERLLDELLREGGKVGLLVVCATQRTGDRALPAFLRDLFGIRIALKVSTWQESRAALGDAAKAMGLDASKLSGKKGEAIVMVDADDAEPVNTWLRIAAALPEHLAPAVARLLRARSRPQDQPAPVEPAAPGDVVHEVLARWPEGADRLHSSTLAELLGVDQEELRKRLAAAGVQQRPQVTIRGVNRRGYHLDDVRGV